MVGRVSWFRQNRGPDQEGGRRASVDGSLLANFHPSPHERTWRDRGPDQGPDDRALVDIEARITDARAGLEFR